MNGHLFYLDIVSSKGKLFSGECDFAVVPTTTGEIGILKGHTPLLSVISKGDIRVYKDGLLKMKMEVESGFVEITQKHVNVLKRETRGA